MQIGNEREVVHGMSPSHAGSPTCLNDRKTAPPEGQIYTPQPPGQPLRFTPEVVHADALGDGTPARQRGSEDRVGWFLRLGNIDEVDRTKHPVH